LTKRINGGTNGLQDRIKYTIKFGKILGVIWNEK
jgi:predicted chitinase